MPRITHYLPELDDPERSFIAQLTAAMSDAQALQFATAYRQARKDPQTILLMAVIGVVAVPGLHRFWLGQVGYWARAGGWARSWFVCARTPSSLINGSLHLDWLTSATISSQCFGRTMTLTASSPSFRLNSSRPAGFLP